MTNSTTSAARLRGDNHQRVRAVAADAIRDPGNGPVSPTDLSWKEAGAKYRAPVRDPVINFNT